MKILTSLLCICLLFGNAVPVSALQPPTQKQLEEYQEDGTLEARRETARQIGNHRFAPDVVARKRHGQRTRDLRLQGFSPAEIKIMAPPPAWQGMPATGNVNIFVLLINWGDTANTNTQAAINTNIFGGGAGGFPYESLTNYYTRSSYGLLTLQGTVFDWFTSSANRADVAETTAGREALIKAAIADADGAGHDFSIYDNDGDGDIDYFAVIWTGAAGAWASFWWGYMTTFSDGAYTVDGKTLGRYSWQWESNPVGGAFNPLVLIHETGHGLGLPDYYDYDGNPPIGGVGTFDMMDSNKGDHNCFSKFMLDWLTPTHLAYGTLNASLNPSDSNADCVKVMPNSDAATIFGEYFLAQDRALANNDTDLPGAGVSIWHVDAALNSGGTDFEYDNSYTAHKLLRLMEADGLEEIEAGGVGDAGDYYTAGKQLNRSTTPTTDRYSGSATDIAFDSFSAGASPRTFTVVTNFIEQAPPNAPLDTVRTYPNPAKLSSGERIRFSQIPNSAKNVKVRVYTSGGRLVRTLHENNGGVSQDGQTPHKVGIWDGRNDAGQKVAGGMYMVVITADERESTTTRVGVFW